MTANVFLGSRYEQTADLEVKEVAALVRAQVRDRVDELKAGGELPPATRVSVRYSKASMMQAITVKVRLPRAAAPDANTTPIPGAAQARAATARLCRSLQREFEDLADSYNRYSTVSRSLRRFYSDVYVFCPKD